MRTAYRVLAYVICGLVAIQAASHAWASAGFIAFLAEGGSIDMSGASGPPPFPEFMGVIIHGMNGMYVIPLVALALLGVAFAAKIPGGAVRAGIVLGLVVLQVALGLLGHSMTALTFLHGLNALVLFAAALIAGLMVSRSNLGARVDAGEPVRTVR
ncbi:MAG: hypothetical protein ACLGHZ_05970 [Actinomycetes bacterium]